jgi:hypothetical protein
MNKLQVLEGYLSNNNILFGLTVNYHVMLHCNLRTFLFCPLCDFMFCRLATNVASLSGDRLHYLDFCP